jgi:hypothetical protein
VDNQTSPPKLVVSVPAAATEHKVIDQLLNRSLATKTIRFAAASRLKRRKSLSYYFTSILSLYVIALSLLPNIFQLSARQAQFLLAVTVVISTFIIILSLTEGAEDFSAKAETLRSSAREIQDITFQLSSIRGSSEVESKVIELMGAYQKILHDCPSDHSDGDYRLIRSRQPNLFYGYLETESKWRKFTKRLVNRIISLMSEFAWLIFPMTISISSSVLVYCVLRFSWLHG